VFNFPAYSELQKPGVWFTPNDRHHVLVEQSARQRELEAKAKSEPSALATTSAASLIGKAEDRIVPTKTNVMCV
jgi:hypothetical protein